MSLSSGKSSNYNGQVKSADPIKINDYLISVDRDLQGIWRQVNTLLRFTGINSANLPTNTDNGFSYIPTMYNAPTATPTNYSGHAAIVFCTSDSGLRIYNASNTSWKVVILT